MSSVVDRFDCLMSVAVMYLLCVTVTLVRKVPWCSTPGTGACETRQGLFVFVRPSGWA